MFETLKKDKLIPTDRYKPTFTEGFDCCFNGDIDDLGPSNDFDGFHKITLGEEERFIEEVELPVIKYKALHHKRKIDSRKFL